MSANKSKKEEGGLVDQRKLIILTTIIKNYLETGEPVGSRTISKYSGLNLSSATIRNEMSDLEEMGYILQPHTSAGRVPSDKGYRFYVDQLMAKQERDLSDVRSSMFDRIEKLESALQSLVRNIASDTHYTALVSGPRMEKNRIKFLQISLVEKGKLLFLLMFEGNIIKTMTVDVDEDLEQNAILSVNLLLNDILGGHCVEEITKEDIRALVDRSQHKKTMETLLRSLESMLRTDEQDVEIYTSGATNIFKYPELMDSENASKLIFTLESKEELAGLLQEAEEQEEDRSIQVYIGKESPLQDMADCALVTAKYQLGNGMHGTIGVIGPKRMDYEKVLDTLSRLIQQMGNIPL